MDIDITPKVVITLEGEEISDLVRILHIAHGQFSGEDRIDDSHCKTGYTDQARESSRKFIEELYPKLPCSWGKPNLFPFYKVVKSA